MAKKETSKTETPQTTREFLSQRQTQLVLEPVNPNGHLEQVTLEVERGQVCTTKEDGSKTYAERFRAHPIAPIEKPDALGMAATIDACVKSTLKAMSYGSGDDFTWDSDSEFFTPTPRTNASSDDPFQRDDADELYEMRKTANAAFEEAQNTEEGAQVAWRSASQMLEQAYDKLGRNGKAFVAWAKGGERAKDAPFIAKLGNGKNALSEARMLAQLTDDEFKVLPATMTRGKTVDLFMRDSVADYFSNVGESIARDSGKMDEDANGNPTISETQFSEAAGIVIDMAGVSDAYNSLTEGLEKALEAANDAVKAFEKNFGKHDDSEEARKAASSAMGKLQIVAQLQEALDAEKTLQTAITSSASKDKLAKIRKERDNCLFIKRVNAAVSKAQSASASAKREDNVKKTASSAEGFKEGKTKAFKERPATEVAAQLWKTIESHPAYAEIYDQLGILVRDQKKFDAEQERKRKEEEKAAA